MILKDGSKIKNKIFLLLALLIPFGCTNQVPGIEGKWLLNNGSIMCISYDDFYWYQDSTKKNYYAGEAPIVLTQEEALEAIHVPESNKDKLLENHIYYYSIVYDRLILNNLDRSSELTDEKSEFAFQMNGINNLSIINLNTNEEFNAIRQEN